MNREAVDPDDPKGLIREAYRIDGIGGAECRSILVDWALSLPEGRAAGPAMAALRARYGAGAPGHPMSRLLDEAAGAAPVTPGRKGGAAGRRGRAPYPSSP